jgi:hypothetical protein
MLSTSGFRGFYIRGFCARRRNVLACLALQFRTKLEIALGGAKPFRFAPVALGKRLVLPPRSANRACKTQGGFAPRRTRSGANHWLIDHLLRKILHWYFEQQAEGIW